MFTLERPIIRFWNGFALSESTFKKTINIQVDKCVKIICMVTNQCNGIILVQFP